MWAQDDLGISMYRGQALRLEEYMDLQLNPFDKELLTELHF